MTQTEKVDASKSGWEMWVADDSLINNNINENENDQISNQQLNKSKTINFNQSFNTIQYTNQNHINIKNKNKHKKNDKSKNKNNMINSNIIKSEQQNSQEGSLTGIGSLSNYKPPQNNLISPPNSTSFEPQIQQEIPCVQQTTNSNHKPDHPLPSPSTNTLGLISSHPSDSRKNNPNTSSKPPNIPYAHAYEFYGRQITRVQPASIHPQPQVGPYPTITPPSQKKLYQPPLAEVCLECMMRDRDMAGVDVMGPGVWARESDADFEQAVLDEAAADEHDSHYQHSDLRSSPRQIVSSETGDDLNQDSQSIHKSSTAQPHSETSIHPVSQSSQPRPLKKRIGKGEPLTMPALKAWTQMNPPATAHRWRTLQLYLREQRHYLDLEQQAKRSLELQNERTDESSRTHTGSFVHPNSLGTSADSPSPPKNYQFLRAAPSRAKIAYRASSATLLTKGMILETLDVSKDEREARKHRDNENRLSSSKRISTSSPAPRKRNSRSSRSATMNTNSLSLSTELLNQVDNLPPASSTHQPIPSSRAPSPTRFSFVSRKSAAFGENMRPFTGWSRARRSGSNSVLSLAPSGSLLDMHVGLSHDRHNLGSLPSPHGGKSQNRSMLNFHHTGGIPLESQYTHKPSLASLTSSPITSRFNGLGESRSGNQKKEKKKLRQTLRGLWHKLGKTRQRSCSIDLIGSPTPLGIIPNANPGNVGMGPEEEPLAPPPPLSALAGEKHSHRRTRSTLSLPLASVCRFGSFRPQSVSTTNAGLDSATTSPMSQNFIPPSPGSKLIANGTMANSHIPAAYMSSPHDPPFDSLAEELETVPCQTSGSSTSRLKHRARSLGTMSLLSGASANEEANKSVKRKTAIEPTRSHDGSQHDTGGQVVCSDLHGYQDETSGGKLIRTNGTDPRVQSSGNRTSSSSLSTPDRPSNSSTLMTISSKMLSKFPGLRNRRAHSSAGLVIQPNSNNNATATAIPAPTNLNGRHENFRSSASSSTQFSTPIPPLDPISNDTNLDPDFHNEQLDPDHHHLNPKDYLPLEKSRHTVSRSSDFLALRYVS